MQDPQISIIIPVYNAEKYLKECLESILAQSFKDIEILCINDGSKDRSLEILNDYAAKDSRIRVFNQENSGPAKARNVGLENMHGEYLMFCDADDTYEPTMCEDMLTTIQTEQVDLVMCDVNMLEVDKNHGRDQNIINYHYLQHKGKYPLNNWLKTKINILLWNKILKTELIKKYNLSFPTGFEFDDTAFIWEYLSVAQSFYGLDKKLYNYKILNNSVMGKIYAQKHIDKIFDKVYALKHFKNFLKNNNILNNNAFLINKICDAIWWMQHFLNSRQQKKFLKLIINEILFDLTTDNFNQIPDDFANLFTIIKKIQSIKKHPLFGKKQKGTTKKYYFFGLPILKKKKTETTKSYYFLGIKIFYKKKKNMLANSIPQVNSTNYKIQALNLITPDNTPQKDRIIICFDCLYDKEQEAIDAYTFFDWLQQHNIPSKYILLKGNKLESQLSNNKDIIIINDQYDFIFKTELIKKSRYIITSFGLYDSQINKTLKNLDYTQYIFIEHGVTLFKKWVLHLYSADYFDKTLVATQLTKNLYLQQNIWTEQQMLLAGMPRWDMLTNQRNGHIFVFFTWRKTFEKNPKLIKRYFSLIANFLYTLSEMIGTTTIIDVALHHEITNKTDLLLNINAKNINIIDTADISKAIQKSSMLITDYSSVCWDFMYQNKPVIFYRFDKDELYFNDLDQKTCLEAMQEDEKLYNCFYKEKDVLQKTLYYLAHNFELESSNIAINEKIFWPNRNNCETLYQALTSTDNN